MIVWVIAIGALALAVLAVVNALVFLRPSQSDVVDNDASVSILIPARNEEQRINLCLAYASAQSALVTEILVYDDQSNDATAAIVKAWENIDRRIRLIGGDALPAGWHGKPHACHRLAENATGTWLLFVDADARLHSGAVERLLATAAHHSCTLLSAWPGIKVKSLAERLLMPMLNFYVFALFPSPLQLISNAPRYALAHGACLLCHRDAYWRVGGHAAVRDELFEDTALARHWRACGQRALCCDGQQLCTVRMYAGLREIWRGFEKNFYPGFRRKWLFVFVLAIHVALFTVPCIGSIVFPTMPFAVAASSVLVARVALALRFRQPIWPSLFHPIAELFLIALGISSFLRWHSRRGVEWKGRLYRSSTVEHGA
ncbi:MAG: glycosyltransferase [Chlorobiota bacterium]|nr:MAG: glycosyltransferase [Chlorobiota bacterium]